MTLNSGTIVATWRFQIPCRRNWSSIDQAPGLSETIKSYSAWTVGCQCLMVSTFEPRAIALLSIRCPRTSSKAYCVKLAESSRNARQPCPPMRTLFASIAPWPTMNPVEYRTIFTWQKKSQSNLLALAFLAMRRSYFGCWLRPNPALGDVRRNFDRFLQALKALSLSLASTALAKDSLEV